MVSPSSRSKELEGLGNVSRHLSWTFRNTKRLNAVGRRKLVAGGDEEARDAKWQAVQETWEAHGEEDVEDSLQPQAGRLGFVYLAGGICVTRTGGLESSPPSRRQSHLFTWGWVGLASG